MARNSHENAQPRGAVMTKTVALLPVALGVVFVIALARPAGKAAQLELLQVPEEITFTKGPMVIELAVRNPNAQVPIRIVGGTTTCSCATLEGVPITVAPGHTAAVHVRISLSRLESDLTLGVTLLTEPLSANCNLELRFVPGDVVEKSQAGQNQEKADEILSVPQ